VNGAARPKGRAAPVWSSPSGLPWGGNAGVLAGWHAGVPRLRPNHATQRMLVAVLTPRRTLAALSSGPNRVAAVAAHSGWGSFVAASAAPRWRK